MQDPTLYSQIKPQFPEQEHLKCPRCDSSNTKFCYYNNYNLSQPRHFCKSCRRYWTKGGALRNIPVGGGSRKNTKRSSSSTKRVSFSNSSSSASPTTTTPVSPSSVAVASSSSPSTTQILPKTEPFSLAAPATLDQNRRLLDVSGSFSSLLASNVGQFGNLFEGLNPTGSNLQLCGFIDNGPSPTQTSSQTPVQNDDSDVQVGLQNGSNSDGFLSVQSGEESSCWNGSNGWPDLAIYTPGSSFQ